MDINKNECITNYFISRGKLLKEKETKMINKSFKINQMIFYIMSTLMISTIFIGYLCGVDSTFVLSCIVIYSILTLILVFGSILITPYVINLMYKNHIKKL